MEIRTAKAEQRTPKMPFNAQYQGVSSRVMDLANLIPVGKNIPISNPTGKITDIDMPIFNEIGAAIIRASKVFNKNRRPIRHPAVMMGYK